MGHMSGQDRRGWWIPCRVGSWAICAVVTTSVCGAPSMPSPIALGLWGGNHIAMTVTDSVTHVELDCAHGDISGPLTVNADDQFKADGSFVREHGGPIRSGEPADMHPARYTGIRRVETITLTIQVTDTNEVVGTFSLKQGEAGRVLKCL
jgi:hypothetical protein